MQSQEEVSGVSDSLRRRQGNKSMENEHLTLNDGNNEIIEELNDVPKHGHKSGKRKNTTRTGAAISLATHVLTTALTVYFLYVSFKSYSLFSWHPACAAIGFLVLTAQSIMVMSHDNILAGGLKRKQRVRAHWILLVAAAVFTLASFVAIVVDKSDRGKHHFASVHAAVGLAFFVLLAAGNFGGVAALYASALEAFVKPRTLKLAHVVVGIVAFAAGVASFVSGLYTNFFRREAGTTSQAICLVLLVVTGVLVLASSVESSYRKLTRRRTTT